MGSGEFNWKRSLLLHLGITITISISLIEIGLFIGTYQSQKSQLIQLRDDLRKDVLEKSGKDYHVLHPTILSEDDIEKRMSTFRTNFIAVVFFIILFVVAITMLVYQFFVGRHIGKLRELINKTDGHEFHYFPESEIPPNDLGDVIHDRNERLKVQEAYHNNLQGKLKEAEEHLVHSAKLSALGELTSTLAHDLKNPLSVIVGNVELLKKPLREIDDQGKAINRLKKIYMASERITKLVKRMGSQARGDLNIHEGVDLSRVLENSLVMLESKIKRGGVKVQNILSNDARRVKADAGAIEQVFMNLVSNSCDALADSHQENPQIFISSLRVEDKVELRVRDNGTGIPADIRETLFSSFVTTKPDGKGTGLGLSIVKQIIDIHEGSIELGTPEEGAEFIIQLPIK